MCLKEAWFQDFIPMEINRLLEDAEEYYAYPNEKRIITVRNVPKGKEYLKRMKRGIYYKTKYWNIKKMLYLLFTLSSNLPEEIKLTLYANPWNTTDIPQIMEFLKPIDINDETYIPKPYIENKKI
jgi:hypothetical protein